MTAQYRRGAEQALHLARLYGCRAAVLKERSPSCGSGEIYDGTFSGCLTPGDGVTAALLKENGIVDIQQFVDAYEEGTLDGIDGLSKNDIEAVNTIISENVEIVEEGEEKSAAEDAGADVQNEGSDEDEYFCPECGAKITLDMTHCPKCGVEFEFTEDE